MPRRRPPRSSRPSPPRPNPPRYQPRLPLPTHPVDPHHSVGPHSTYVGLLHPRSDGQRSSSLDGPNFARFGGRSTSEGCPGCSRSAGGPRSEGCSRSVGSRSTGPASLCAPPGPSSPPAAASRVRPSFSFKDAVLSPPSSPRPLSPRPVMAARLPALPSSPPRYLLNPSLRGRCFRCFDRGHRAASCRDPRRCLLCMNIGHPASRCRSRRNRLSPSRMDPPPPARRPRSISAFLPSTSPLPVSHHFRDWWLKSKQWVRIFNLYRRSCPEV